MAKSSDTLRVPAEKAAELMSKSRPTLADVAHRAGVSVSTASLAFSGAGPIAAATKQKVMRAAEKLGYHGPNPLGRQLRSGRSGIVGVVVGDALRRSFRDPVSVRFLDGIADSLGEQGLGVLLIPGKPATENAGHASVNPLLTTAAMDVAVLIWGAHVGDERLEILLDRHIPIVNVEGGELEGVTRISIRDREASAQLLHHLLELGHTKIATVTLPLDRSGERGLVSKDQLHSALWEISKRRVSAFDDVGVEPFAVWSTASSLLDEGVHAAKALLSGPDRPTAIVAQSDLLAAGVILGARELGLRVPEDLSVVGFDGVELPWLAPDKLTTANQPLKAKGKAVGAAVAAILAGEKPEPLTLDVELMIGTTTAAPSSS